MSKLVENIKAELEKKRWTASDLSRASSVPQPTIQRILSGNHADPRSSTLKKIAHGLNVSEQKLLGYLLDDKEPILPGDEFIQIHFGAFQLQAGISGYSIDYLDDHYEPLFFRSDWIKSKGLRAQDLIACKISGDSMMPGLYAGDTVLIDRSNKQPVDGQVFAINYEGELVIKRMIREQGNWYLSSDNQDKRFYPNKICNSPYCEVIGKIVHKQSTVI